MESSGAVDCAKNLQCYIDTTVATINAVTLEINFWSRVQLVALVATGVFGVLATVMIALQGDNNKVWTRPIGIVATALVTGIASLTTALHVPENVDKLIDIRRQFTFLVNNLQKTPARSSKNSPMTLACSIPSA